jgi:hypothetical protein
MKGKERKHMNLLKRAVSVVGAITLIVASVAVLAPKTSHAVAAAFVQIVPGPTTHVGQTEGQLVSLFCEGSNCVRQTSGVNDIQPFTVPTGYTFVLTDFGWLSFANSPNAYTCAVVELATSFEGISPTQSCAVADFKGVASYNAHLTTGATVASGSVMFYASAGEGHIEGYLVPN